MSKSKTKDACAGIPMMEQAWRARDDAETLRRAGEIMGDKSRMSAAQREVNKSVQALQKFATSGPKPRGSVSPGFAKGGKR